MSQRAIAPIAGVSQPQVSADLSQVISDLSPDPEPEDDALTGGVLDPKPAPEPIQKNWKPHRLDLESLPRVHELRDRTGGAGPKRILR